MYVLLINCCAFLLSKSNPTAMYVGIGKTSLISRNEIIGEKEDVKVQFI